MSTRPSCERSPRTPRPTNSSTSPSGWASWSARWTPACSTSGKSCATRAPRPWTVEVPPIDRPPPALTANRRAFTVLVRNALFQRVEFIGTRQWQELEALDGDDGWTAQRWFDAMAPYFDQHGTVGIGADARNPALLMVDEHPVDHPGLLVGPPDPPRPRRGPRLAHPRPRRPRRQRRSRAGRRPHHRRQLRMSSRALGDRRGRAAHVTLGVGMVVEGRIDQPGWIPAAAVADMRADGDGGDSLCWLD